MYRVIITGSREFYDWRLLFDSVNDLGFLSSSLLLKFGDCKTGADLYADMYACATRTLHQKFAADWDRHRKAAGPIRNHYMVDSGADLVLAFPAGRSLGTMDCCMYAHSKGLKIMFPELELSGAPDQEWWKWAKKLA